MTKLSGRLRFGFCPRPTVANPMRALHLAEQAEMLGLDYVHVQNRVDKATYYEPWSLLTILSTATSHMTLIVTVTELPWRSPALLGKVAAALEQLTGGRVELALDAAAAWAVPQGSETRQHQASAAGLEGVVQRMRQIWRDDGGPAAAHRIGIWLHANEPQALALTGRLADGWMAEPYPAVQPSDLTGLSRRVDEAATAAGREPSELQRIWTINGNIGDQEHDMPFQGTARQWAASLAEVAVAAGIDTFLLQEGEHADEQLQRFAREVVPHARELVEQAIGTSASSGLNRAHQGAGASGATPAEEETGDVDWVDETSMESFPASDPPASDSTT